MASTKNTHSITIHYCLTFFAFVLILGSFATHIFTGKPALLQFDSLAGSLVLGIVFLLYAAWIIYDDAQENSLSMMVSLITNIKKNPTFIFIFAYWIVLIIIPFLINILL